MAESRNGAIAADLTLPAIPDRGGRRGRPLADLTAEYVSGGGLSWLTGNYLRTLPQAIDDLDRDFPDSVYAAMLLDPAVASSINLLKLAILSDDLDITPAADEEDPAFARAQDIADSCKRMCDELETPLADVLWQMADALAFGNKVAEQVYGPGSGPDSGRLVLRRLVPKPRRAVAFVVDPYLRIRGLLGRTPAPGASLLQSSLIQPESPPPNLLPREKFVILTWRAQDGDPRGTSILRPAYNAWWIKTQAWPGFLKYLAQFGTPSLWGTTSPDAPGRVPSFDADGLPVTDGAGNQVYVTPEQAMFAALVSFQNSSVAVFPAGSTLATLEPSGPAGSGQVYQRARDMLNSEITLAILCQTLANGEARFGARAAAQVHQDVLGLVIRQGKQAMARMVRRDILALYVRLNWGEDAAALTPKVTLGAVEQQDTASIWGAVAHLMSSGYLDQTQQVKLDAEIGLPVRDREAIEARQAEEAKLAATIAAGQGQQPALAQAGSTADARGAQAEGQEG